MIIEASSINLGGSHDLKEYQKTEERLHYWVGDRHTEINSSSEKASLKKAVELQLSDDAKKLISTQSPNPSGIDNLNQSMDSPFPMNFGQLIRNKNQAGHVKELNSFENNGQISAEDQIKVLVVEELFYQVTGKRVKIDIFNESELKGDSDLKAKATSKNKTREELENKNVEEEEGVGWGLEYDSIETRYESEKTSFSAEGVVKTADGKEIHLDVAMSMSREFIQENHFSVRAGDALIDPLVINFHGRAADLDSRKFEFDLDMDGEKEQISTLKSGSAYLAIDRNEDGIVNDGSELFGPSLGDGFKELAEHDDDGNGWIDANDSVYDKLRVWTKDPFGKDQLLAIGEVGVGAIYLKHASTEFSIKSDSGEQMGKISDTSVYLNENGSVGTVQELHLVV